MNLEEAIKASLKIIDDAFNQPSFKGFESYISCYMAATECIKEYLLCCDYNRDRALTVLGSGDHIFNLLHQGIEKIDAFDVNKLQYFVYHLRKAMLLELTYDDFCRANYYFAGFNNEDSLDLVNRLKNYLPEDVYEYFRRVFEHCIKENAYSSFLFHSVSKHFKYANIYLKSEEEFLKVKKSLLQANVTLYFENAINIPNLLNDKKYDIILLSNIADYFKYSMDFGPKEFEKFIASYYRLLRENGIIINYLYNLCSFDESVIQVNEFMGENRITPRILGVENLYKIWSYPYGQETRGHGYYLVKNNDKAFHL